MDLDSHIHKYKIYLFILSNDMKKIPIYTKKMYYSLALYTALLYYSVIILIPECILDLAFKMLSETINANAHLYVNAH